MRSLIRGLLSLWEKSVFASLRQGVKMYTKARLTAALRLERPADKVQLAESQTRHTSARPHIQTDNY